MNGKSALKLPNSGYLWNCVAHVYLYISGKLETLFKV